MKAALATLLIAACVTIPLPAQQLTHRAGLSAPAPLQTELTQPLHAREVAPNNWLKGMLIGTGIGLGIGVLLGNPFDPDNGGGGVQRLLALTAVCAVMGALIGSGFRKH